MISHLVVISDVACVNPFIYQRFCRCFLVFEIARHDLPQKPYELNLKRKNNLRTLKAKFSCFISSQDISSLKVHNFHSKDIEIPSI